MVAILLAGVLAWAPPTDYRKDFDELENGLKQYGAYARSDGVDFNALRVAYRPRFASIANRNQLMTVLEALVGELHDFHASLGTNNDASPRLVPSGTDLVGRWEGDRAYVDQVRSGSLADKAGLAAGDEIVSLDQVPVRAAAKRWFGVLPPKRLGWEWALNSALAGRWDKPRVLGVVHGGVRRQITLTTAAKQISAGRLTVEVRPGNLLYLRPEDSLGHDELIGDFDKLQPRLLKARRVILDLRNTPSGGNTSVARGIMGLFISKRLPYQRHLVEERSSGTIRDWVEYATPRHASPVRAKLVVLVDRWTGSMGEGLAVGFDAMKRATVIGTRMAGLRGAVDSLDLPVSGIRVFFPTEQVFHPNGTPRHLWVPPVVVKPGPGDPWMSAAITELEKP